MSCHPSWRIGVFAALFADLIFRWVPATVRFQAWFCPHGRTHQSQQPEHLISHSVSLHQSATSLVTTPLGQHNWHKTLPNRVQNTPTGCLWISPASLMLWASPRRPPGPVLKSTQPSQFCPSPYSSEEVGLILKWWVLPFLLSWSWAWGLRRRDLRRERDFREEAERGLRAMKLKSCRFSTEKEDH